MKHQEGHLAQIASTHHKSTILHLCMSELRVERVHEVIRSCFSECREYKALFVFRYIEYCEHVHTACIHRVPLFYEMWCFTNGKWVLLYCDVNKMKSVKSSSIG